MKYIVKSNLIILVLTLVASMSLFVFLDDVFTNSNTIYAISVTLMEAFVVKVSYDFLNLEHDHKYFVHKIPKNVLMGISIALNIMAVIFIFLISGNLKYLLLINLIIQNGMHILIKRNPYFIILTILLDATNLLIAYHGIYYLYWILGILIISIYIGYKLRYKKVKVYTYDNY